MRRAVFLDRDGCVIEDVGFLTEPDQIRILPGAVEGLRRVHEAGFELVIVSNQSGVARGYLDELRLAEINERLTAILLGEGIPIVGVYCCPHHPEGAVARYAVDCDCRKPKPGMLLRAAREHELDLSASAMVGDSVRDVEAGKAAGCRLGILIGEEPHASWPVVRDLADAADVILDTAEETQNA